MIETIVAHMIATTPNLVTPAAPPPARVVAEPPRTRRRRQIGIAAAGAAAFTALSMYAAWAVDDVRADEEQADYDCAREDGWLSCFDVLDDPAPWQGLFGATMVSTGVFAAGLAGVAADGIARQRVADRGVSSSPVGAYVVGSTLIAAGIGSWTYGLYAASRPCPSEDTLPALHACQAARRDHAVPSLAAGTLGVMAGAAAIGFGVGMKAEADALRVAAGADEHGAALSLSGRF